MPRCEQKYEEDAWREAYSIATRSAGQEKQKNLQQHAGNAMLNEFVIDWESVTLIVCST